MSKDSFDRLLAGSARADAPAPDFDAVIGHRPRRRKLRRAPLVVGAIVIASGAAFFALPDVAPQISPDLAGVSMDITIVYATDWLAEPPGYEWISDTPDLVLNTGDYHADL
jgi:hypothetical protein